MITINAGILTRLGILDTEQKMGTLSGGQRKRVALAACLVPFLIIAVFTTPLIYAVTAWAVQLTMRLCRRKEH